MRQSHQAYEDYMEGVFNGVLLRLKCDVSSLVLVQTKKLLLVGAIVNYLCW